MVAYGKCKCGLRPVDDVGLHPSTRPRWVGADATSRSATVVDQTHDMQASMSLMIGVVTFSTVWPTGDLKDWYCGNWI